MKDILQQLYDGEIYPAEDIKPTDSSYRDLTHSIESIREYLIDNLSKEDRARVKKLDQLYHEISCMDSYAHYTYGFRLGATLMMEILGNGEGLKE